MQGPSKSEVLYSKPGLNGSPSSDGYNPTYFGEHFGGRLDPRSAPRPAFLAMPGGEPDARSESRSDARSGSFAKSRNNSTSSVMSIPAPVQTPVSQIDTQDGLTFHRFGSVSSILTATDDEESGEPTYPWDRVQDTFLMATLDAYVSDPTNAPFSGRFPPSGVVHQVAKMAIKRSAQQRLHFPHKMGAVRKRLLLLCNRQEENATDLPDAGHFMVDTRATPDIDADVDMGEDFDFDDEFADHRAPADRFRETAGGFLSSRSTRPGIVPVTISTGGLAPAWTNDNIPLASPFKESFPRGSTPDFHQTETSESFDDEANDIVNIVAKRKRDSLRMKRGLK